MDIDKDKLTDESLIDMKFITQETGMSIQWIYRLIKNGEFPKQKKLGRSSRWQYSEYKAWKSNLGIAPKKAA